MRLYVINLDRSPDRLARLGVQFSKQGLDFTRIEAVDACALSDAQYRAVQEHNIWSQNLTRGEVACFLSHGRALERFIADDVPYGVIFEDDVTLGGDAAKLLNRTDWLINMTNKTGERIDIVKLETSGKKVWLGQPLPLEGEASNVFALARLKSTHIMAAAYLISRHSAMRLVDVMRGKAAPFDHFLFNFSCNLAQEFALYQLDPAIVVQAGLVSTLEGERALDKKCLKSRRSWFGTLTREARRLVRRTSRGLWGMKINLFSADQWKYVPFRD